MLQPVISHISKSNMFKTVEEEKRTIIVIDGISLIEYGAEEDNIETVLTQEI